eukprot:Platyproteum_vivax@DN5446_c0_g1_i1.p1
MDKPFKCQVEGCNYACKKNSRLERHNQSVHIKERTHECSQCGDHFARRDHLQRHIKNVHEDEATFPCPVEGCDKAFKLLHHLHRHQKCHNKTVKCDDCGSFFAKAKDLRAHKTSIHSKTGFACTWDDCTSVFSTQSKLNKHMERHTGARDPYECEVCGAKFCVFKDLTNHQKSHPNAFECKFCPKSFRTSNGLFNHLHEKHPDNAQNALKLFVDSLDCSSASTTNPSTDTPSPVSPVSPVSPHSVKLEEEPKFPCGVPGCTASFTRRSNLLVHTQSVHEETRAFCCHMCDKTFNYKQVLWKHLRSVHAVEDDTASLGGEDSPQAKRQKNSSSSHTHFCRWH